MSVKYISHLFVIATLAIGIVLAGSCEKPTVKSSVYTAADAHFSNHGIVAATFSVQCANKPSSALEVYAVFRGRAVQAAQDLDSSQYQVTFSESEKTYLPAGSYAIDLYDEDGFAQYRKAQRGEAGKTGSGAIPEPMARIEFDYPRVRHSLWVHSETVAVLALLGASFYAYSARKAILS